MSTKSKFSLRTMSDTNLLLIITCAIFVIMYILAVILFPTSFGKAQSFLDILSNNGGLIITSIGMSIVMIVGSIDISVGGVVALVCTSCAAFLERSGGNVPTSILIALGIGLAFGLIQGYLVAYLEIQPFIVTLAGMFFARGMTTIVGGTNPTFNVTVPGFKAVMDARVVIPGLGYTTRQGVYREATVEPGVLVALLLVIVLFFVMRYTKLGRHFYAVGGNQQSALMLGINVKKTKFMAHLLCGILAGIGGFVYFLHVGSASPTNASGMEMNAIASSIIGGTMLTGGVGNMFGTLIGVLSLNTIKNVVVSFPGLSDPWWTGITIAAMLCLFLVIQSVVMSFKKKVKK